MLDPKQKTQFRSGLGGLLWLCLTRFDLIADVALQQQEVTTPNIGHLREVNSIIARAKKYRQGCGLYFRKLTFPLKIVCAADAGANTKKSQYYREGALILLMSDDLPNTGRQIKVEHSDSMNLAFGGQAHILGGYGRRAKRVSWSTSQGETLAAVGSQELAQLIAARLTEVLLARPISLSVMTRRWAYGLFIVPVDHLTDCNDMFEQVTGDKALPQDRGHRLYVAALRELRITGRVRRWMLVPTKSMIADCLTKPMVAPQALRLLTSGVFAIDNIGHPVHARLLIRSVAVCTDHDLIEIISFETS